MLYSGILSRLYLKLLLERYAALNSYPISAYVESQTTGFIEIPHQHYTFLMFT